MLATTILIVEDDAPTAEAILEKVTLSGFRGVVASSVEAGRAALRSHALDVVVLDLNLPDGDGLDLCREIRQTSKVPIIMLTSRVEEVSRIVGLEVGADDYITKPFSTKELIARIRAVLRRSQRSVDREQAIYRAAGIELDEARREVRVDGDMVHLTPIEYSLLSLLMRSAGEPVSRQTLIDALWGYDERSMNLLEMHVGKLRRKIELDPRKPTRLVTVRTVGYKIAGKR